MSSVHGQAPRQQAAAGQEVDLGEGLSPDRLRCTFQVLNPSKTAPMKVRRVRASCSCVRILSYPAEVSAGGVGALEVQVFPEKIGPFQYKIWVETPDLPTQFLTFRLRGTATAIWKESKKSAKRDILPQLLTIPRVHVPEDCFVSVQKILKDHQSERRFTLVDVRGEAAYRAAHIPGALSLPVFALRTSVLLKGKDVILVGRGHGNLRLLRECQALREQGAVASAFALKGGMNSWINGGGAVQGAPNARKKMALLPPVVFHQIRGFSGWCFLEVASQRAEIAAELFPESTWVTPEQLSGDLDALRGAASDSRHSAFWVLIANETGDYRGLRELEQDRSDMALFFLDGGLRGYRDFLRLQSALQTKATVSNRVAKPCAGCP
ncbi:MAG: DUF1573 domain-containing protein [Lentisphaeria bacterium]|nr:DUF1573 domain-containing protein [Lentisphaeria bacterium]